MPLPSSRRARRRNLGNHTLIPRKVKEQTILETISKHSNYKDNGEQSTWIYKEEIILDQPDIVFYNGITSLVNKGKAVDIVCLGTSKTFACFL